MLEKGKQVSLPDDELFWFTKAYVLEMERNNQKLRFFKTRSNDTKNDIIHFANLITIGYMLLGDEKSCQNMDKDMLEIIQGREEVIRRDLQIHSSNLHAFPTYIDYDEELFLEVQASVQENEECFEKVKKDLNYCENLEKLSWFRKSGDI